MGPNFGNLFAFCDCCIENFCNCSNVPDQLVFHYNGTGNFPAGDYPMLWMGPPAALSAYANILVGVNNYAIPIGIGFWSKAYVVNTVTYYLYIVCDTAYNQMNIYRVNDTGTKAAGVNLDSLRQQCEIAIGVYGTYGTYSTLQ